MKLISPEEEKINMLFNELPEGFGLNFANQPQVKDKIKNTNLTV